MHVRSDMLLRNIAGEQVVLPMGDSAPQRVLTLNGTGAFIWRCLEQETNRQQIVRRLLEEYSIEEDDAYISLDHFLTMLQENHCLI